MQFEQTPTLEKKSDGFEMVSAAVEKYENQNKAVLERMSSRSKSRKLIELMLKKAAPFVIAGASLLPTKEAGAQMGMQIKDNMRTESPVDAFNDPYPIQEATPLFERQVAQAEPIPTTKEIHTTVAEQKEVFIQEAKEGNFWETIKDAPLEHFLKLPENTDPRIIAFSNRIQAVIEHAQGLGYKATPNTTVEQGLENAFYMGFAHQVEPAHPQE